MGKEASAGAAAPAPIKAGAVTGVASGGLGTAANLEDTQLWDLDDLGLPEEAPTPEPVVAAATAPTPPARARVSASPAAPVIATAPAVAVVPRAPAAAPIATVPVARAPRGERRTGPLAAAAIGIIVLATVLALRDGLPGGAASGSGDAAGAFPSVPAVSTPAPKVTPAPKAESGGGKGGGGNGHGNGGKGNGHGGKDH
jgi:hypothetical protein